MKKAEKKIISIFLVLIIFISQFSIIFAVDYVAGEEIYETLDEYLEVYYPGQAKEEIKTLNIISSGDTIIIKNMESLKQMTNLKILEVYGIYCNEIDLQGLDNLVYLDLRWVFDIDTNYNRMLVKNINTLGNLKFLQLCEVVIDGTIKGECFSELLMFDTASAYTASAGNTNYLEIDNINHMESLRRLFLDRVVCDELDFDKINKLTSIDYRSRIVKGENGSYLEELNLSDFKLPTTIENVHFELDASRTTGILNLNSLANLRTFRFDFYVDEKEDLKNSIEANNLNVDNIEISAYIYTDDRTILEEAKIENYIKLSNYDGFIYNNDTLDYGYRGIIKYRENINYGNFIDTLNSTSFYGNEFELNEIDDFTGLEYFDTLEKLYIEKSIANFDVKSFPNLTELTLVNTEITQGLDLRNSYKLKKFSANDLTGDLSNVVINANKLSEFYLSYIPNESSGFELEKCILIDDYGKIRVEEYNNYVTCKYNKDYYDTIDEYLQEYYPEVAKEEITEVQIFNWVNIKDYSGLSNLPNLAILYLSNSDLEKINFELTPKLERIKIYNTTLNGILNLSKNANLRYIDINLKGDLSNAVVDIRGLNNLEYFNYEYYTDRANNFNLDTCILKDDNIELTYSNDPESIYERYYYDKPDYPEYIVSNLDTSQIDENTKIIYGFVLNNEGNLKLVDILSRNYFTEGITAKIFKDGTEVTNAETIVGTGTIIKLYKGEELVEEYTIVIYGDSTGDGEINAADSLAIIKNKNQRVLFENEILEAAGRVTEKAYIERQVPSAVDALAIIKYSNGKYDIDQRYYW